MILCHYGNVTVIVIVSIIIVMRGCELWRWTHAQKAVEFSFRLQLSIVS